jgi:hypothetical protein
LKGGGFYIETSGDGIVLIQNVTFESCSTTMAYDKSSYGGSLYFESSLSGLTLTIKDC